MSVEHPTGDDYAGMAWWNGLSESARRYWKDRAESARAVDAWRAYKRSQQAPEQDKRSWDAGYLAGLTGDASRFPCGADIDGLSWSSGYSEGEARRTG